jgi:hypothetical protein
MRKTRAKAMQSSLFLLVGTFLFVFFAASPALAQRDLMTSTGGRGQLNIDSLIGLRIGTFSGPAYSGPLGISSQSYSQTKLANGVDVDDKFHYTTFWFAPSADYFVIDQLSLGGLFEIALVNGTAELASGQNARTNVSIPTTTAITILPRIGYLIPIGSRFGIWPRLSVGYVSRQNVTSLNVQNQQTDTFGALTIAADVPFLFRLNETFYVAAAPEFLTSIGGSHTTRQGGVDTSANASVIQFGLNVGFGVLLDL